MPYAIDLFCGAGGCSEGLIQAGFHILFSSDISDMVEVTYRHRHEQLGLIQGENTWFERADIRNLTGEEMELNVEGADLTDAHFSVIDQERLLSWAPDARKLGVNEVMLIEW